jgi:hypothetical protein
MSRTRLEVVGSLVALYCAGCSSAILAKRSLSQQDARELNELAQDRDASIVLTSEAPRRRQAQSVMFDRERIWWREIDPGKGAGATKSAPYEAVNEVTILKQGCGAAEGLGIGLPLGLLLGSIVGYSLGPNRDDCNGCFGLLAALGGGLVGVITGSLVGAIAGAAIGHRTTIEFESSGDRPAGLEAEPAWQ